MCEEEGEEEGARLYSQGPKANLEKKKKKTLQDEYVHVGFSSF